MKYCYWITSTKEQLEAMQIFHCNKKTINKSGLCTNHEIAARKQEQEEEKNEN